MLSSGNDGKPDLFIAIELTETKTVNEWATLFDCSAKTTVDYIPYGP